jgi:cell division transport system permease protein
MLQRFGYFARETWNSLIRNWAMTVAGILVIAVSLLGLGAMYLNNQRVHHYNVRWRGGVGAEIFMRTDASENQKSDVRSALDKGTASGGPIKSYRFLAHADALAEFKRLFHDDPDIANSITDASVLPESFRVKLRDAKQASGVVSQYKVMPGVDEVALPQTAINQKLDQAKKTEYLLIVVSIILAVAAGVLVVNTIRLAIFARRREIEVMKLVGASNWFVRVPFMAEGLLQGLVGGVLAGGGVYVMKWGYEHWFYETGYYLTNRDAVVAVILVVFLGAILGAAASFIGLWRRLDV